MRKKLFLGFALVLLAMMFAGCDGRIFLNLDVPIVIEPSPPRYRAEVDGYLSYDYRNHHIVLTTGPNYDRYYEPLRNAKVTVVETGSTVYTDREGYFFVRGVPNGKINLKIQHNWVGPYNGVFFSTWSY